MTLKIYVNKKDIREGKEGSCFECPVARAATRSAKKLLGKDAFATATPIAVRLYRSQQASTAYHAVSTRKIVDFISAFDGRREVHAFNETLILWPGVG